MRHPEGLVGWVDLTTTDVEAARAFYSQLLGWTSTDMPTPMGPDYTQFFHDGKKVAGMGPMWPDAETTGMPSSWSSYVMVSDLDATMQRIATAGGHVVMPAMDVMTEGRMAMAADPSGAVIGLWQPIDHDGADVFNAPGSLTWNELQSRDLEAARPFYAAAFGWRWELNDAAIGYWVANVDAKAGDDKSNAGAMPMPSIAPAAMPSTWFVYFAVNDCDATLATALALGGSTMFEPMEMGPGRFAGIVDPTGAAFMVIAMDAPA